jgi:hypothetical protein
VEWRVEAEGGVSVTREEGEPWELGVRERLSESSLSAAAEGRVMGSVGGVGGVEWRRKVE